MCGFHLLLGTGVVLVFDLGNDFSAALAAAVASVALAGASFTAILGCKVYDVGLAVVVAYASSRGLRCTFLVYVSTALVPRHSLPMQKFVNGFAIHVFQEVTS